MTRHTTALPVRAHAARGAARRLTRAARRCAFAVCAAALLAGCGGGDAATGPDTPRTRIPDALVGQWQNGISALPGLNDWLAQTYSYPVPNVDDIVEIQSSTLGFAWYFYADGRYEHIWMWDTGYAYGARVRKQVWHEQGAAALAGAELTLSPAGARYTALDSCSPGMNTDGPVHVRQQSFTATLGRDEGGEAVLSLRYPSGSELTLYRPEHWTGHGLAAAR
jgi:hypothetical protein